MLLHLKNENFNEEIKEGKVLVDFYADWCGPCKMLAPVLEELDNEKEIKIVKVNVDEHEDIAREFRVMSIPNLVLFQDGKPVKQTVGFMNKNELSKWVD